jgi:hypothetical protein
MATDRYGIPAAGQRAISGVAAQVAADARQSASTPPAIRLGYGGGYFDRTLASACARGHWQSVSASSCRVLPRYIPSRTTNRWT